MCTVPVGVPACSVLVGIPACTVQVGVPFISHINRDTWAYLHAVVSGQTDLKTDRTVEFDSLVRDAGPP